mgnify:FL=1
MLAGLLLAAAALESLTGRAGFQRGSAAVGLALVFAGLALHLSARRTLGALWSGIVEVRAGHTVIAHGPYARVRHPIYLALALLAFGSLLVHPSALTAC